MTRETKLGLLVGMAMIIFICILVSDYLAKSHGPDTPDLSHLEAGVDPSHSPRRPEPAPRDEVDQPLPTPGDDRLAAGDQPRPQQRRYEDDLHRLTVTDDPPPDVLVNSTDPDGQIGDPAPREDAQPERRPSTPRVVVHHVQPEQRLWDIAVKYYGDGNYYKTIYEANKDKMPSPDVVRTGVRLVIPQLNPDGRPIQATAEPDRGPTPTPAPRYQQYTVQRGDTMGQIATMFYGTSRALPKLVELNADRIDDPNLVPVGMVLRVPAR